MYHMLTHAAKKTLKQQLRLLNAAFPHRDAFHRDYLLLDAAGLLPMAAYRGNDAAGDDLSYLYYAYADGILPLAQMAVQLQKVLKTQRVLPPLIDNRAENDDFRSEMSIDLWPIDDAAEHVVDGIWLMEWALQYYRETAQSTKMTVYDPILKALLIMYDQQQWKPQKHMLASMLALLVHKPLPGLSMLPVYGRDVVRSRILPELNGPLHNYVEERMIENTRFIHDYRGFVQHFGRQGVDWTEVLQCICKSVHFNLIEEGTWIEFL